MGMKFVKQHQGQKFFVVTLQLNDGSCPATDYLEALKTADSKAHKRLTNVIELHANDGPIMNTEVSRPIKGKAYQGLYEFKTPQGARLYYFNWPGSYTVLTNGCNKGPDSEMRKCWNKAKSYKEQLEAQVAQAKKTKERKDGSRRRGCRRGSR